MSRGPTTNKYGKKKLVFEKGNQITTYQKEPTTWIEINEDEFPVGITNQNILQILEYRETSNPHFCNNITVLEENIIQEIITSTSCVQTDYVIDKYKYLKEDIKPYFLCYFELDERDNVVPSRTSILSSVNVNEREENLSFESSISRLDKATWISPSASNFITDYLKGLADKTVTEVNSTVLGSKVEPLLPGKVFHSHQSSQEPQSSKVTKELTQIIICGKSSAGNISQFVNEVVFDKNNCKEDTGKMSQPPDSNPEAQSTIKNCSSPRKLADSVNVICKQGDVKFRLKCQRVDDGLDQDDNSNIKKYACKIATDKTPNLEKFLENVDRNKVTESRSEVIAHDIKCNSEDVYSSLQDNSSKPNSESNAKTKAGPITLIRDKTVSKNIQNSEPRIKMTIKPSVPNIDHSRKEETADKLNTNDLEKNESEKVIFACRSKSKDPKEVNENRESSAKSPCKTLNEDKRETNIIQNAALDEEQKTAIATLKAAAEEVHKALEACATDPPPTRIKSKETNNDCDNPDLIDTLLEVHNSTVATIKAAAVDLITNIPTDKCAFNKMKHQAEDYASEIQKKLEDSSILPEVRKTSSMLIDNTCKLVKTIKDKTEDSVKNIFTYDDPSEDPKVKECNRILKSEIKKPREVSCSREGSGSVEKIYESVVKTAEEAKKSLTELASQGMKAIGVNEMKQDDEDAIENLKRTAEKLITDVRKKTEEFKEMSTEERMELIRKTTEILNKSITDLTSNDTKILNVETRPPPLNLESTIRSLKKSTENIVNEIRKISADEEEKKSLVDSLRKSAANLYEQMAEQTIIIKQSAEKIAQEAKEGTKINEIPNMKQRKENIEKVLSGCKMFKKWNEPEDEDEKPKSAQEKTVFESIQSSFSSTLSSIKSTLEAGCNFDLPEKSSAYDVPTPPKEIAMKDSANRLTGMFATLKDKIYSIFSGNKDSDSQGSRGSHNARKVNSQNKNEKSEEEDEDDDTNVNIELDERLLD